MRVSLGVEPMRPRVVAPVLDTAVVISLLESYWTLSWGDAIEVMVIAPELAIPPAYMFPELSTLKSWVSPAAFQYEMKSPVGMVSVIRLALRIFEPFESWVRFRVLKEALVEKRDVVVASVIVAEVPTAPVKKRFVRVLEAEMRSRVLKDSSRSSVRELMALGMRSVFLSVWVWKSRYISLTTSRVAKREVFTGAD
jgi:hypothetical protein